MMKAKLGFLVGILSIVMLLGCTVKESSFNVGFVTDIGGIDDKSFNQGTWEGIVRFSDETGLSQDNYTYLQSNTDADYIPNLSTLADNGASIVVASGFLFTEAVAEVAKNFPETRFLIIDTVIEERPNVVSAIFSEEQCSFLVGVVAALQAQKEGVSRVGFIGGMEFDVIYRFEGGFEAGVKAVDPSIEVLVEYAGNFAAPQIGQALAVKLFDAGAKIVFAAAGATGNGTIKEAKDRALSGEKVWVIGVDKDQYEDGIYEGDTSIILTSAVKRVDVAAYDVIKSAYEDRFPGGEILSFNLSNGGVGIPENNPNLTKQIIATVEEYKQKVLDTSITVPRKPSRLR